MKKRLQGFLAGFLVCCLVLGTTVFATGTTKTIKAVFNAVTVKIDGKVVNGDNIKYNGNVYVNTKNLATYLGKTHTVDKSGNINISIKTSNESYITKSNNVLKLMETETIYSVKIINGFLIDYKDYPMSEQIEVLNNMYPQRYMKDGTYKIMEANHKKIIEQVQNLKNPPSQYKDVYSLIIELSNITNSLYQNAVQSDGGIINFNMPKISFSTKFGEWKNNYISITSKLNLLGQNIYYSEKVKNEFNKHFPMTDSEK